MRILFILLIAPLFFASCGDSGKGKTFCDTTCVTDTFKFNGSEQLGQLVKISVRNCEPDSLTWTHKGLPSERQIVFNQYVNQPVRLNKAALDVAFQDTSVVWLSFNDCKTGRGYLFKLPYRKGNPIQTISAALNSFDKKFSVDPDLRAYTDRGNIYVVNVTNGKEAQMTFKEEYKDMDFNKVHESLDSINVTKQRVYVKLLKEGKEVPLEKKIDL
jgi:hypothetical protein